MVYILSSVTSLIAFEKGIILRYVNGFNHLPKCYFLLEGKLKAQAEKQNKTSFKFFFSCGDLEGYY